MKKPSKATRERIAEQVRMLKAQGIIQPGDKIKIEWADMCIAGCGKPQHRGLCRREKV